MLGADLSKLLIRLMELAEMSAQTALAWIHVYHPQYLQELEAPTAQTVCALWEFFRWMVVMTPAFPITFQFPCDALS